MTDPRDAKDYAIEHAGYLALAATGYLDAINAEYMAQMDHEERPTETTEQALNEAIEAVGEANRNLRNCIYEFEKRRDRAAASPVAAPVEAREPAWCPVHEHYKWCEHNGGVMGPSGYASPVAADTQGDAQALTWAPSPGVRRYIVEITTQKPVHKLDVLDALHRAHLALRTDIAVDEVPPHATVRAAMKEQPSDGSAGCPACGGDGPLCAICGSVSPLGPGEDEYLSWVKELERASTESPARGGRQG